jgi:transposase
MMHQVRRSRPSPRSIPAPADLALLRARVTELAAENSRLREAAAARDELAAAQLAASDAQLAARVEELERRLGKDSSTSSKPPSSDSRCAAGRGAVPASSQARSPRR